MMRRMRVMIMPVIMIVMSMGMGMAVGMGMFVNPELGCGHTGLHHAIDGNIPPVDGQAAKRLLQLIERQAGIDERAEDHVAGRAGETIKVEKLHGSEPSEKLKYLSPWPRMMWSARSMPMIRPASASRLVTA